MVTIKNLFQVFGHDPRWAKLATASAAPMATVYLRKYGNQPAEELSVFNIELWATLSEQPDDRKVKAKACAKHLREWAIDNGHIKAEPVEQELKKEPMPTMIKKQKATTTKKPGPKPGCHRDGRSYVKPEKKYAYKHSEHLDALEDYNDGQNINIYDSQNVGKGGRRTTGTIYHDNASRGWKNGKRVFKDCWRAEITISGQRYKYRSKEREDCVEWLRAVKQGKIKPTDNKADWQRMEQRKDDSVRIDELIVSAAEESVLLYDYHQTKNIEPINDYIRKRLLPHMVWYCAHTLQFGYDRTVTASRQAIALLLTRITADKPVMNFTATCKRMLRVYKQRGNFFYYENAPELVRIMVNGINFDGLADVWKVTKDRRI